MSSELRKEAVCWTDAVFTGSGLRQIENELIKNFLQLQKKKKKNTNYKTYLHTRFNYLKLIWDLKKKKKAGPKQLQK